MSENRVLRKIFVPNRAEVTGKWRRQQEDKRYDLYLTPNIIRMIISRRMSGAWNIAWGKGEVNTGFWWEGHRVGDHFEDLGVDRRIILKWTYKKWDGGHWLIGLVQDRVRWWAPVNAMMNLWVL